MNYKRDKLYNNLFTLFRMASANNVNIGALEETEDEIIFDLIRSMDIDDIAVDDTKQLDEVYYANRCYHIAMYIPPS